MSARGQGEGRNGVFGSLAFFRLAPWSSSLAAPHQRSTESGIRSGTAYFFRKLRGCVYCAARLRTAGADAPKFLVVLGPVTSWHGLRITELCAFFLAEIAGELKGQSSISLIAGEVLFLG